MKRAWYAVFFTLAVFTLSFGGVFAFRRLAVSTSAAAASEVTALPALPVPARKPFIAIAPDPAEYDRYEAADAAWRTQNARPFTLRELRERGDGTRSPREALQDRVYAHTKRGNEAGAITELERWVAQHPDDQSALLSLARLLNENGRNADAIARYRQLLSLKQRITAD